MSGKETPRQPRGDAANRDDRLKQALKANLARRKAQAKVRGAAKAGDRNASGKGDEQEG